MAFPVNGILDDFNRTNEGPPPSTNWSRGLIQWGANTGLQVGANELVRGNTSLSYRQGDYWNPTTFGPNVEIFATVKNPPDTDGGGVWLWARCTTIGDTTTEGYALAIQRPSGTFNEWTFYRLEDDALTALGSSITQAVAAGDSIGLEIVGSTLTAYHKPSAGSWTAIGNRTDSVFSTAGHIGIEMLLEVERLDDFGGGTITATGQSLGPSADSVDGNWLNQVDSNVNLFASVDEDPASDSDYIKGPLGGVNDATRMKLETGTDPAVSTGHDLKWRISKNFTGGAQINATIKLYQGGGNSLGGGTLIKTADRTNVDAWTTYTETLSGGEADAITNYSDLYVEVWETQV